MKYNSDKYLKKYDYIYYTSNYDDKKTRGFDH